MIKKLQHRLVLASIISLFVVLTIIIGTAAAVNYTRILANADNLLGILQENNGTFPEQFGEPGKNPEQTPEQAPEGKFGGERRFSPETPYEARFFSVFLNESGTVTSINTGRIAAVDSAQASEYAEEGYALYAKNGKRKGFLDDYRYSVVQADTGELHVVFLDCGRTLDNFRDFLTTSAAVALLGLCGVLLILLPLSRRIVRPFLENDEKQKRFITDAGHELKTPLAIINADAEVLEMDHGENEWLEDIKHQTRRMTELTNNLVILARMEEEPSASEFVEFPFSDVVESTVETFRSIVRTKKKQLIAEVQPAIFVKGDEKALQRLLTILLDNAVKYSDEQGVIKVVLSKVKNSVVLTVYNTADTVSKKDLPHLFDRFYRADKSRSSKTGGYGLGLSIAAATVQAHKGKIMATTDDEKSLTIMVNLPL